MKGSRSGIGALAVVLALYMLSPAAAEARPTSTEPIATTCAAETFVWFGQSPLAPGESLLAGTISAAEAGSQLLITGLDTSPSALSIRVGDTKATGGSNIPGGDVTATNTGTEALVVSSVALNLDRCHQVAVEAVGGAVGTAAISRELPETDSASPIVVIAAACSTTVGLVLVRLSRRRHLPADRSG